MSSLAGRAYPYRSNSLNLFRLVLAAAVLFAHSFYIVGAGEGPQLHGENLGGWAVAGFFVLSGFLITRSRMGSDPGTFLLHRVARIFPAFIVCLVVTAFVFAPIAALMESGTLAGFLSTPVTPLQYVWTNITLYIDSYTIGDTLRSVPYPGAWNGSLWTLFYEFLCYMIIWVLGGIPAFRRNAGIVTVAFATSVAVWIAIPLAERAGLDQSFFLAAKLVPFFLGGSLVFFVVDRFGMSRLLALVSLLVAAAAIVLIPRWGGQAAAPFIAYALLWASAVVPQPRWIARNDVSYGFYIYAWPVQQLLVLAGGAQLGVVVFSVLAGAVTFLLAWSSWVLVERGAMKLARSSRSQEAGPAPLPSERA